MKKLLFLFFLFLFFTAKGQLHIGIAFGGIAYHPQKDKNAQIYKWKIDKKGHVVAYTSFSLFASYRINRYFGLQFVQAFVLHDCAGKFSGITHLGIDLYDDIIQFTNPSDELSGSIGPFWYYRKNWTREKAYENNPRFIHLSKNKKWETKFVWYGGQIEWIHQFPSSNKMRYSFLPGLPYILTFGVGQEF